MLEFGFLKDRYDYELRRKEELTTGLTLPVGVLSVLSGLLTVMARSFTYEEAWLTTAFLLLLVIGLIAFSVCLLFLAFAYHRQTYEYLPLLRQLEDAFEEFAEFNAFERQAGGEVEASFDDELRRRIIEAADANTRQNDQRAGYLFRARVALLWLLGLTALTGVPYVINQIVE